MTQGSAGRTKRWWLIIGSVVAVLLAGAYVLLAAWQSTSAPSGARSMGVDIGGMDRDEAVTALTDGLGETPQQEVDVVAGESSATFDPVDAGLSVDVEATVDSALGFSLDPRVVWSRLFEDEEIAPVLDIDEDALGPVLESTSDDLTLEPVDAQLEYDEDRAAIVTKGEDGIVVADSALREAIEQQWLRADEVTV